MPEFAVLEPRTGPNQGDQVRCVDRAPDTYFEVERTKDDYERTWRRLLDDEQTRGIAARLNGKMVEDHLWEAAHGYLDLLEGVHRCAAVV